MVSCLLVTCCRRVVFFVLASLHLATAGVELKPTVGNCTHAVVGAGWAGVYAAWRLVIDSRTVLAKEMCIFEATSRPGGRTYSVESSQGLVIDVGAYRFPLYQHLPHDLITGPLGLRIECYQPSCSQDPLFNKTLWKIVDATGQNAGYATPLKMMLVSLLQVGVRVFYKARLESVLQAPGNDSGNGGRGLALQFVFTDTGERHILAVKTAVLNLPRNALLNLSPRSIIFSNDSKRTEDARNRYQCAGNGALEHNTFAIKAYVEYTDAWWVTKLNLTEGQRTDLRNTDAGLPPIDIRYHDGPVKCIDVGDVESSRTKTTRACHGALQVMYEFSDQDLALGWYLRFQQNKSEVLSQFDSSSTFLWAIHSKLMQMHAVQLVEAGWDPTTSISPPIQGYVGFWLSDADLQPCPHVLGPVLPSCVHGEAPSSFLGSLQKPLNDFNLFIANNDFWYTELKWNGDWAQSSLVSVERLLHTYLGLSAPSWLNAQYYSAVILGREDLWV